MRVTKERGRRSGLERPAIGGNSPVVETSFPLEWNPEYGGTREIPPEAGRTISQG